MALKMDRLIDATEIGYYFNEVSERGVAVVEATGGSGVALDNPSNVATATFASASGQRPLGILLNDFVSIDFTRIPLNWYKDQASSGDKCTILTKGWCVTNKVNGAVTAGDVAVLDANGFIKSGGSPGTSGSIALTNPTIGRFRSSKDAAGYARVYVDL